MAAATVVGALLSLLCGSSGIYIVGASMAYTGKCDELGLDGTGLALTPALYKQGYDAYKDAVCIPFVAFCAVRNAGDYCDGSPGRNFTGDVTLGNMNKLIYVGGYAFQSFSGKLTIQGSFPKLEEIGVAAFIGSDENGRMATRADSFIALDGADVGALKRIENSAFADFAGTLRIQGPFPKMERIGQNSFSCSCIACACNADSSIVLDGTASSALETVEHGAFYSFKGKLTIQGPFPKWKEIGAYAFLSAGTDDSLVAIECRGETWEVIDGAFDDFKGNHNPDGEKIPCPATTIMTTTATSSTTTIATMITTSTVTPSSTTAMITTTMTTTTTIYDAANVDCSEQQADCTAACEQASQRDYKVLAQPEKKGKACIGATDCWPGDGQCPTTDTTTRTATATFTTTTNTVAIAAASNSTTIKTERDMSAGGVAALVIVLLVVAVAAAGFGGWYKGWIQVPAWLSRGRNKHSKFGNDGDGAPFDPAIADMFPNPLPAPSTSATTTIEVAGATTISLNL